jgi:hypothetical protein
MSFMKKSNDFQKTLANALMKIPGEKTGFQISLVASEIRGLPHELVNLFWDIEEIFKAERESNDLVPMQRFCEQLQNFRMKNPNFVLNDRLKLYAYDCFIILRDYKNALDYYPEPKITSRASFQTSNIMNLKLLADSPINAHDLLTLFGPRITTYGKDHIKEIEDYINSEIFPENNITNEFFLKISPKKEMGVGLIDFYKNRELEEYVKSITRVAENAVREKRDIAKVGENWISEAELLYIVRSRYSDAIHHATPDWLKPQHLDIFIPSINLAIEYQGKQHYEEIKYFGGEKAYTENKKRDIKKKNKCKKHNIRLIYWKYDEKIDEEILDKKINAINLNNKIV